MNGKENSIFPQVEIISPNDECSCSFSIWMNRVWDILNEFDGKVNISSISSDSKRANELGATGRTVVVNGSEVPVFLLKETITKLLS